MQKPGALQYSPPWSNTNVIGIAGSSGSGKTSLALAVVAALNLPWVVILSMAHKDSFYKPLTAEQSAAAFRNEFDFDAPGAIDFDLLVDRLKDLKHGRKADVPIYSFEKHARIDKTQTIYSPHVLILEGIFALHDQRILDMLDLKVFCEADADTCLSRRLLRDVSERGRDIEGCIKQWFSFVKPNFHKWVKPQREIADIIVPRGVENKVAIDMIADRIRRILQHKSAVHQDELRRLGVAAAIAPLSENVMEIRQTPQVKGINTLLLDSELSREDFIVYFDRLATQLMEQAAECIEYTPKQIETPHGYLYMGLKSGTQASAVVILRGGSILEPALRRTVPDCKTSRLLIQTSADTGEPELHFLNLAPDIAHHGVVFLLDSQVCRGGAILMAVRVLVDHGVEEGRIVVVAYSSGRTGINRLLSVFPEVRVVVGRVVGDSEDRWAEKRYLGC